MQIYKAPVQDMLFQLEVFGYEHVLKLAPYASYDRDMVEALLKQASAFATEEMLPINRSADEEGLKWDPKTGAVTMPKGFKEVYAKLVENGFAGINGPSEYGGAEAPLALSAFMSEMWTATNKSLSMCPGLTAGLAEALHAHGSKELQDAYMPKLVTGEWAGTMCLTESQAGTDLGLLRTKAVVKGDHYSLTGTKIWITFGEHDLTENIIHLVLARLPDAPAGIKGISCFVVPKITLDGKRNGVTCSGLEHKMGIHASPTCVVEMEDAEGWLVGEPHRGMRPMFAMMNNARLLVGVEGVALSDIAYQTALAFARERRQMRALDPAKQDKEESADLILVHPDVRRLLLNVKSTVEGLRGLATWIANLIDVSNHSEDEAVRQEADDLVQLLTPVIKSYGTERGFLNVSDAMQVCGGAGYTRDWSIEQYLRDVRIGMIYEGTNHVQALDLVGRKLPRHGGRMFQAFSKRVATAVEVCQGNEQLEPFGEELRGAMVRLTQLTMEMGMKAMADAEVAGAAASNYLNLFALTAQAYSWVRQITHAVNKPGPHTATKLKTARFYFDLVLPEGEALAAMIRAGKDAIMAFDADEL